MRPLLFYTAVFLLALTQVFAIQTSTAGTEAQDISSPSPDHVPLCNAEHEGRLSCQANRVCACIYDQAVPARGLPDRWRWDCALTRPPCEQPAADGGDYRDPSFWPLIIDRQDREHRNDRWGGRDRRDTGKDGGKGHKDHHPRTPD